MTVAGQKIGVLQVHEEICILHTRLGLSNLNNYLFHNQGLCPFEREIK